MPTEQERQAKRGKVAEMISGFAKSYSKQGMPPEKLSRYTDVLEDLDLNLLREGLHALKGLLHLPSADRIREAVLNATMRRRMEQEAKERREQLNKFADPRFRQEVRDYLRMQTGGLIEADILAELVEDAKNIGVVGEDRTIKLIFLSLHTRHFDPPDRPVSVVMKGASSAGKSWTTENTLRFLEPGSVITMTGMSPKYLYYASGLERIDFRHKYLYVHEASGIDEEIEKMLRVLLSEGRIRHNTLIEQQPVTLTVEGPTGLIETTTRLMIHWENETRMLSIPVDESPEQTARVVARMAKGSRPVSFARWHALDKWIAFGPKAAVIPFQEWITAIPVAPRVRRDWTTLVQLVRVHALLHESQREIDERGRVIATLDDYQVVHELTRELFAAGVDLFVPHTVRKVVIAAQEIIGTKLRAQTANAVATSADIAKRLQMDRGQVNRSITAALAREFLEETNPHAGKSATQPHRVIIGSRSMPDEDASIFPTREQLEASMQSPPPGADPSGPSVQGDGAWTDGPLGPDPGTPHSAEGETPVRLDPEILAEREDWDGLGHDDDPEAFEW